MLMRRTTPLPIAENEMETTTHGHIAILADGSFAMTRAHGGPLVATFYDDLMEAINHVGARTATVAAIPGSSPTATVATAVPGSSQGTAPIAPHAIPVRGLTPGAPATRAAVPGSSPGIVAAVPGSSPGIAAPVAASTATPAALTPAEQALAAHIASTIQTP